MTNPGVLGQMQRIPFHQPTPPALMSQLNPGFRQRVQSAARGDFLADYVQAVTGPASERVQRMQEIRSGLAGELTKSLTEATNAAEALSGDTSVRSAIRDARNQAAVLSTMQSEPGEPLVIESMQKIQRLEEACRSAEANGCPRVPVQTPMAADTAPRPTCGCGGHSGIFGPQGPAMTLRASPMVAPAPPMTMGAASVVKIDTPAQSVVYYLSRVFADIQMIMQQADKVVKEEDERLGRNKDLAATQDPNNA